ARRAPPSIRPGPHLWSESSSQGSRFVPARRNGWAALSAERQPFRSRRTPSASGRILSAGRRACHITRRSELTPTDAASGWRLSLPACSASVASSCVRSIILLGGTLSPFPSEPEQILLHKRTTLCSTIAKSNQQDALRR